ncbi:MAG: hypothetical protein HYV90_03940 [Candidatus Woesebacteria bacterium]|nr:MAG: hypothetical protein HYV90_03940 [Candidatus Woesebacteria bacterium]
MPENGDINFDGTQIDLSGFRYREPVIAPPSDAPMETRDRLTRLARDFREIYDPSGSMGNPDINRSPREQRISDNDWGDWSYNLFPDNDHLQNKVLDIIGQVTKKRNLESISRETVARLLLSTIEPPPVVTEKESSLNRILWETTTAEAQKVATDFYAILRGEDIPTRPDENELTFIEAAKTEIEELGDDVDPRIIRSQISALHGLVYGGGLDDLYRKYKEGCAKFGVEFPSDEMDVLAVKTELAYMFLDKIRHKNEEEKFSNIPSGVITLGMEVEYTNFIANELKTCGIYEALLVQFNEDIEKAEHPAEKEVYEEAKKKIQTRLNILKSILQNRNQKSVEGAFKVWEPGKMAAVKMGVIEEKAEISATEIATKPAASYKTQLRELVSISTVGGLRSSWGVHETFGGVELSTKHTEFMDGLPIAIAAGFIDFGKISDKVKSNIYGGFGIVGEKHTKPGYDQATESSVYFPFHRSRTSAYMEVAANVKQKNGIELRSLPEYNQKSFPKLVRQLSFHYLFAHGVKSIQKEESARTDQDKKLVEAYSELLTNWKELLAAKDIEPPTNEEKWLTGYHFSYTESETDRHDTNPYIVFVSKMVVMAQEDPEFSKEVRRIIRVFSGKTRKILGEN